jgi:SAM-dependent methyltransferase
MTTESKETWSAGQLYEPYVGRWSRLVAREFLGWLVVAPGKTWLDVGCGTGALAESILRQAEPRSVRGVDTAAEFVEHARAHISDPRAKFEIADAQSLPVESGRFDAAVSGLVLNFVPRPELAVGEMARAVGAGGVVAAYVWDYSDKMELMRYFWDAAVALYPAALDLDEGRRFPICRPDALMKLFSVRGLHEIEVQPIDVQTQFGNFEDYWSPFLGGQGPAPGYAMSLSEERRAALREYIRAKLPFAGDGSIHLIARAWAVRGHRP